MKTTESKQVLLTRERDFEVVPAANTAQRVQDAVKVVLDCGCQLVAGKTKMANCLTIGVC